MKMIFTLVDDSGAQETESMWVVPSDGGGYKVKNCPFRVFGINLHDIVAGEIHDGILTFGSVLERSGHSTYRLINTRGDAAFSEWWARLEKLGCRYEEGHGIYAVDVPPATDIYQVYDILSRGEAAGIWDFEEAGVGHSLHSRES